MISEDTIIKIGKFGKPHGVKGELSLETDCDCFDDSEDFYILCRMNGLLVPFYVDDYRWKGEHVVLLSLEGVTTSEEAREFVNADVYVPKDWIAEEDRMNFQVWSDLIGYEVEDVKFGRLGKLSDVDDSTENVLLNVECNGRDLLIPAVENFVKDLDDESKKMIVDIPAELLEL